MPGRRSWDRPSRGLRADVGDLEREQLASALCGVPESRRRSHICNHPGRRWCYCHVEWGAEHHNGHQYREREFAHTDRQEALREHARLVGFNGTLGSDGATASTLVERYAAVP